MHQRMKRGLEALEKVLEEEDELFQKAQLVVDKLEKNMDRPQKLRKFVHICSKTKDLPFIFLPSLPPLIPLIKPPPAPPYREAIGEANQIALDFRGDKAQLLELEEMVAELDKYRVEAEEREKEMWEEYKEYQRIGEIWKERETRDEDLRSKLSTIIQTLMYIIEQ